MTKKEICEGRKKTLFKRALDNDQMGEETTPKKQDIFTKSERKALRKAKTKAHKRDTSERVLYIEKMLRKVEDTKIKDSVFSHYGNKCACCGETIPEFLTIDHINEDGAEHRKEIGSGTGVLYKWLIANGFPKDFQILCRNCNWGKYVNGGICPHKTIKEG